MPRSTAAAIAVALLMVIGAAAVRASWDAGEDPADEVGATTTAAPTSTTAEPATTSTSEGGGVTFTVTLVPTSAPPATTAPTTSTTPSPSVGLPPSLAVPGPDVISLSGDSSWSLAFAVAGVPEAEVSAWVRDELVADGWEVREVVPGVLDLEGPNAIGVALVSGDDPVAVAVQLNAP